MLGIYHREASENMNLQVYVEVGQLFPTFF